jgi:hypothetical protein
MECRARAAAHTRKGERISDGTRSLTGRLRREIPYVLTSVPSLTIRKGAHDRAGVAVERSKSAPEHENAGLEASGGRFTRKPGCAAGGRRSVDAGGRTPQPCVRTLWVNATRNRRRRSDALHQSNTHRSATRLQRTAQPIEYPSHRRAGPRGQAWHFRPLERGRRGPGAPLVVKIRYNFQPRSTGRRWSYARRSGRGCDRGQLKLLCRRGNDPGRHQLVLNVR